MTVRDLADIPEATVYDVIVIGAGAAGMAAALFAAIEQQKVLLVERTEFLGGTSALSGATTWVPNTHHAAKVNPDDSAEAAKAFLDAAVGNFSSAANRQAFLDAGPKAIATLEQNSAVQFRPYATHPDYEQQHEGATMRGRALEPLPFDGRTLGNDLRHIRSPIPEFTIFGGMMVDRTDINHLLKMKMGGKSLLHALKILGRYGGDRLSGRKRGTRLVMGNALIGRLLKSLLDRGVDILVSTEVRNIRAGEDGASGITIESRGVKRNVSARKAIVLAAGGFGRHPTRRAEMLHAPTPEFSPTASGHTGAAQDLALKLGARFGEGGNDHAYWAPVSVRKRADQSFAVFPHFVMDRSKPGTLCVDQSGRRFVNETTSYHNFARAMFEAHKSTPTIPCWILCDADALKKYGLGMVRMGAKDVSGFIADGYLKTGSTIAELAATIDVPEAALTASIAEINAAVESGVDPRFGRGTTAYHRVNGDATAGYRNPTIGPIRTAPFYAVALYPGDIGAATGLAINADAQVLAEDDRPIGKLYAAGAEAQSIMGGTYPGPGITIGPGIVFAYRAIQHALHGKVAV